MKRKPVDISVNALFEVYGLSQILRALARRLNEESAIAAGEGEPGRGNHQHFADELDALAEEKENQ